MTDSADLVIPAESSARLKEILSWDGLRPATLPVSDFPVDVLRLCGSASPPVVLSRSRRAETLKALPASLRARAQAAFQRAARVRDSLPLAHGRRLDFTGGTAVMGVVNVTPDSFSDGGLYADPARAVHRGLEMFAEGAAIVDVGGESTRPATYGEVAAVLVEEEIRRVLPVIDGIRRISGAPLSIDTRKAAVARAALAAGADLVNDVSGFRYDPEMAGVVAEAQAGAILMHMKGLDNRTMQEDVSYDHPIADVAAALARAAAAAQDAGVAADRILLDPGLGFGKGLSGNLILLRHLAAFRALGFPLAAGASRKAFVRRFSGVAETASADERLPGSLACLAAAARAGAALARVHDIAQSVRFLSMMRAIEEPGASASAPASAEAK